MKCECKAIVKVNTPGAAKIISNSLKVVQVNSDEEVNNQMFLLSDLIDVNLSGGELASDEECRVAEEQFQVLAQRIIGGANG
jgi:hypothetical protein